MSLIPRSGHLSRITCPAVNTTQPPRRPQLARRSSGAQPAFRRRGSACTPRRRRRGSAGPAPPPAAALGFQSPACGPQTLTCPPRRPRPCSERSSLCVQRAQGTQRRVLARARPARPEGPPPSAYWQPVWDEPCLLASPAPLQAQVGPTRSADPTARSSRLESLDQG